MHIFDHLTIWVIFFSIKIFWVPLKSSSPLPKMPPPTFPLRWESTGDKWWYASPIDWAAANGHYALVRELLRLDGNHLIKLTSLRRVRRLEAVWDAEFHGVAKCRCEVARQLFDEMRSSQNDAKHPLIAAGYGGWLLYTAAAAGDVGFVRKLLGINPLMVFGDGEYGVTDVLYAAARSKNLEVFRVVYDFAVNPRFGGEVGKGVVGGEFEVEVKKRGVHAAARGGNLMGLKELLGDDCCGDVLELRDDRGSTVLHAAAGKGQLEVVNYLVSSYDMISSTDDEGNTPLHIAAYRGQASVLEALIQASPSLASVVNKAGNTFLHMAVSGFGTPGFCRLDRQTELLKQLVVSTRTFNMKSIINARNNEGKTALHLAIIGNVQSNLVQLLMSVDNIDVNVRDNHGMTPLDYLNRQPQTLSSEMLIRQLVSVGGLSKCKDHAVRKAFASHVRMQSVCNSPGAAFRMPDNEILLRTGIDRSLTPGLTRVSGARGRGHFRSLSEASEIATVGSRCRQSSLHVRECVKSPEKPSESRDFNIKKLGNLQHSASNRLKTMLHWPLIKKKETEKRPSPETPPIPLRERFSNSNSLPGSNKRTLGVRSNISSPTNRKKLASGVAFGILQDHQGLLNIPRSSVSSSYDALDKGKKEVRMEDESTTRPSCSKYTNDDMKQESVHNKRRFVNPSLWFRGHHLSMKNPIGKLSMKQAVSSAA